MLIPLLARWIHGVALALWLGGLVAIGALVAPTAFHVVRSSPGLAGNVPLQTALAGGVVGGSLRLFNVVSLICGVLIVVADLVLLPYAGRRWMWAGLATTVILLGLTACLAWDLFPAMDAAQARGAMARFDALHHQYERLSGLELPLLLLLGLCAAGRDTGRPTPRLKPDPSRGGSGGGKAVTGFSVRDGAAPRTGDSPTDFLPHPPAPGRVGECQASRGGVKETT